MNKLVVALLLIGIVAGCGSGPQPTEPPPTQTPWIVVITSTSGPTAVTEAETPAPALPAETVQPTARPSNTPRTSATEAVVKTPTHGAPTARPTGGVAETPAAMQQYAPPALREPPDAQPISWKSTMLLKWSSVGELAEDEYYHVHLERRPRTQGETWYGDYVFTKETEHRLEVPFLAPFHPSHDHGNGVVYWWVWVVRKTGTDPNGKPIGVDVSGYSEERTLIVEPKPEGQ